MVHTELSPGGVAGVDSPLVGRSGTFRYGLFTQYENDPLLLYESEVESGAVVANRSYTELGLSADISSRVSARVILPFAQSWGTESATFAQDGFALGDIRVGVRGLALATDIVNLGARLDLALPSGAQEAWMGEGQVRAQFGALAMLSLGPVDVLGDVSIQTRQPVAAAQSADLTIGSQALTNLGGRVMAWPDTVALTYGYVGRLGLSPESVGENASEVLGGVQVWPASFMQVDVGAGKGVGSGVGTSEYRAYLGVTFVQAPRPEVKVAPQPTAKVDDDLEDAPDPADYEPPPPPPPQPAIQWNEGELARVQKTQIVIREPIQFDVATDQVLPESVPVLEAVAKLLNENPELGIMIEGHASEEGAFDYNYALSNRRAEAVYRQLILAGVYPGRLAYRGMGEVVPVAAGSDDASLAANRRVVFHIIGLPEDAILPEGTVRILQPWDGNARTVTTAAKKEVPKPEPKQPPSKEEDKLDRSIFEDEDPNEEQTP